MTTVLKIQKFKTNSRQKVFKTIVLFFVLLTSSITVQAQWTQLGQTINGKVNSDLLGSSVSLNADGSIMAVGAPHEISSGTTYNGYVQVYRQNNGNWTQIGQDIEGEAAGDYFGASVSLSADGSVVAIGAPYNDGNYVGSGHVRVFKNINDVWTQIGNDIDGGKGFHVINGVQTGDFSGSSVSLNADGSIVAIGAPYYSKGALQKSGIVRIYQNNNGVWSLLGIIEGENEDDFLHRTSLSADGLTVAVGAQGHNRDRGMVRIFKYTNGAWLQEGNSIVGEAISDNLGFYVSLNSEGSTVAIGSYSSKAFIYKNKNNVWTQIGQDIYVPDRQNPVVNVSINADGSRVAVGLSSITVIYDFQNSNNKWIKVGDAIFNSGALDLNAEGTIVAIGSPRSSSNGIATVYQNTAALGTQELANEGIAIYPNPTNGVLNLKLKNNEASQVFIYDVTGKIIYKRQLPIKNNQLQIDLSRFNHGMYFIKIQEGSRIVSTKIVKL